MGTSNPLLGTAGHAVLLIRQLVYDAGMFLRALTFSLFRCGNLTVQMLL